MEILALLEDVHLTAADDRDAALLDGKRRAVDQVPAAPRPDPDQLVVVVPVRLAPVRRAHVHALEPDDLRRLAGIGKAVHRQIARRGVHLFMVAAGDWRDPSGSRCRRGRVLVAEQPSRQPRLRKRLEPDALVESAGIRQAEIDRRRTRLRPALRPNRGRPQAPLDDDLPHVEADAAAERLPAAVQHPESPRLEGIPRAALGDTDRAGFQPVGVARRGRRGGPGDETSRGNAQRQHGARSQRTKRAFPEQAGLLPPRRPGRTLHPAHGRATDAESAQLPALIPEATQQAHRRAGEAGDPSVTYPSHAR